MTDHHPQRAVALVAVSTLLAGCSSGAAGPTPSPASSPAWSRVSPVDQPRVLFQATGPTRLVAAIARLDGTDLVFPLEDLPGGDQTNPDWSPDGSRFVVVVDDGARDDLWVADADGGHPELLVDCAGSCVFLDDPAWSPDGSTIVFSRTARRGEDAVGSLETVDVATGDVRAWLPARSRTFTAGARWSPSGAAVVYESIHTVSRGLDAEVDGVTLRIATYGDAAPGRPRTEPGLFAGTADWSPDGARIAYSSLATPDAEAADLFVMPADRGSPRQVTRLAANGGYATEPTWRADNVTLVFSGRVDPGFGGPAVLLSVDTARGTVAELGARDLVGRHPRLEPGF